jgi:hypothetical protein
MALIAFVFVVSALAGVLPQGVFEVVHPTAAVAGSRCHARHHSSTWFGSPRPRSWAERALRADGTTLVSRRLSARHA